MENLQWILQVVGGVIVGIIVLILITNGIKWLIDQCRNGSSRKRARKMYDLDNQVHLYITDLNTIEDWNEKVQACRALAIRLQKQGKTDIAKLLFHKAIAMSLVGEETPATHIIFNTMLQNKDKQKAEKPVKEPIVEEIPAKKKKLGRPKKKKTWVMTPAREKYLNDLKAGNIHRRPRRWYKKPAGVK